MDDSFEEPEDQKLDFTKRDAKIQKLRSDALGQIWQEQSFVGIVKLLAHSGAPYAIGWNLAGIVIDPATVNNFLQQCLEDAEQGVPAKCEDLIRGFLQKVEPNRRTEVIATLMLTLNSLNKIRLLNCCPFGSETWRLLPALGSDISVEYWKLVIPIWGGLDMSQVDELIDRLLEVGRPRAAFHAVHLDWTKVETNRLKRILREIVTNHSEPLNTFQISSYDISIALNTLQERKGVSEEEMSDLEFLFIRALDDGDHGIPNLERQLGKSPTLFAQVVSITYKRSDGAEDPPDWRFDDRKDNGAFAAITFTLLRRIRHIPGTDKAGSINPDELKSWVDEVRALCLKYGRGNVGDQSIGQILASAPIGSDNIWPCESVREVIEEIYSNDIATGVDMGIHNSRGVHFKIEGGTEERDLSNLYRNWSKQLTNSHPFVASLLDQIASGFDRQAVWEDSNSSVRRRLLH